MQLVDQPSPLRGQIGPPLIQQCQHRAEVFDGDRGGVTGERGYARRSGRVNDVVLAAPAAGELPHPEDHRRAGRSEADRRLAGEWMDGGEDDPGIVHPQRCAASPRITTKSALYPGSVSGLAVSSSRFSHLRAALGESGWVAEERLVAEWPDIE